MTVGQMTRVVELADLNVRTSALVHELQRERGRTSLFMGSQGTRFGPELATQRGITDKASGEFKAFLSTFGADAHGTDLVKALTTAQTQVDQISTLRPKVDQLSVAPAEATAPYTATISALLDLTARSANASQDPQVAQLANATLSMSQAKERVGQERAGVSGAITAGKFEKPQFEQFVSLRATQATALASFRGFGRADQVAFLEQTVKGASVDTVNQMEQAALQQGIGGDLSGLDASVWFDRMTDKIDLMRTVEMRLGQDIQDHAQDLAQGARSALMVAAGITLASLLLTGAAAILVMRSIVGPLHRLARVARGLAVGDLEHELESDRGDELGELASAFRATIEALQETAEVASAVASGDLGRSVEPRSERDVLGAAFKQMTASLRELVGEAQRVADEVASASAQLGGAADSTAHSVQQVGYATRQVAEGAMDTSRNAQSTSEAIAQLTQAIDGITRGAIDQATRVREGTASATQMAAAVEEVAASAHGVASAGTETRDAAERGGRAVRETVTDMREISLVVGNAADKVTELGRLGDKIGAVVETIDDIAEQTNLLALNAAIEAARAGQHGKGFAVVADEVRKLAERSSRETKQIAHLIRQVQSGTRDAVSAIQQGATRVERGTARADQAGEALDAILVAVDETVGKVSAIADAARRLGGEARLVTEAMESIGAVVEENTAATEEMLAQSNQVASAIHGIAAVSEEQSASSAEVSSSAEEMGSQVEEVSAQAQTLAGTAAELRSLVARFRMGSPSDKVIQLRRAA
jgi:methyl-accepting chemotaxis protein